MKKQWILICFLLTGACSCLVSGTSALYTTSNDFMIDVNLDYFKLGYLEYEFAPDKTCGYLVDAASSCTQGSVDFEHDQGVINIKGDAGALRKYPNVEKIRSYDVNVHIAQNQPAELKNFGIYFNGSHVPHGETGIDAIGYVLRFKQNGDLVITKEGYENQGNLEDHHNDVPMNVEGFEEKQIADAAMLEAMGLDPQNLQIKISVVCSTDDSLAVTVYLNGTKMNQNDVILYHNLNDHFKDGSHNNRMIGVSTYGDKQLRVDDLYVGQMVTGN